MCSGCVLKHFLHCQCRGNRTRGPLQCSHIRKVIGQMLRINRNRPINRGADAVNAEHLVLSGIVGFGFNQALSAELIVKTTGGGIFENTLKCAVPFFRHFTRQALSQHTDTICAEIGRISTKENRNHSVIHLGSISILVMPPVRVTALSPGYSSGKPEPSTWSFFGSVPL